jgi:hypothetical protein
MALIESIQNHLLPPVAAIRLPEGLNLTQMSISPLLKSRFTLFTNNSSLSVSLKICIPEFADSFQEIKVIEKKSEDLFYLIISDSNIAPNLGKMIESFHNYCAHYHKDEKLIKAEGYCLSINLHDIMVVAQGVRGCFYAIQTLRQLYNWGELNESDSGIPMVHIFDYPRLEIRAFHLDMKKLTPTYAYVKDLLYFLANYKYNCIMIEFEDKFPYEGLLEPIVHKLAWNKGQHDEILKLCDALFIEVVPLIQVFGHVETYISKPAFKHLQETASGKPTELTCYESWSLCPLHPESIQFAFTMVDQIANAHPQSRYIHIGADEVYQLGSCPKCAEYLKNHSKSELYILYINQVAKRVIEKGKIPIMWHDYLQKFPENLDLLDKNIIVMYWIYQTWRNLPETERILPGYEFFKGRGCKVMGAPSISSDFEMFLPNYRTRIENIAGQAQRCMESQSLGLLLTSWVVCANPLDTQLVGTAIAGSLMWSPIQNWREIPWKIFDAAIQTQFFGIPLQKQIEWLETLANAGELARRVYPTESAREMIPQALNQTSVLKALATKQVSVIESMLLGLEFRKICGELIQIYFTINRYFKDYAENESDFSAIPSMDLIRVAVEKMNGKIAEFQSIQQKAVQYYTIDLHQIEVGEWDWFYKWERYNVSEWAGKLPGLMDGLLERLDALLLHLYRFEMELKF